MKLPDNTKNIILEHYERGEEYIEMLPTLTDKMIFMSRMLATSIVEERDAVEYLQRRLEALECCAKNTRY